MTERPDTSYFEKWKDRWPDARRYYVFASVSDSFAGFKIGTPAFETAVADWIAFWSDPKDRSRADLARIEILRSLATLDQLR